MDAPNWEIISSAIAGSALSMVLAKAFIAKSLKDLETIIEKIADIKSQLAAITVRLEALDKTHYAMRDLERKIIVLETGFNGYKSKPKNTD